MLYVNPALADQCPSASDIKERKISREYDWTIDERRSLEDVLSVEKLYSVRSINQGEFIACYYSRLKGLLRLDGKPEKGNCSIDTISGDWELVNNGEQVCKEGDLSLCVFVIKCE